MQKDIVGQIQRAVRECVQPGEKIEFRVIGQTLHNQRPILVQVEVHTVAGRLPLVDMEALAEKISGQSIEELKDNKLVMRGKIEGCEYKLYFTW